MPRPAWFDKAPDVQAVAAHLEACAATAKELRFSPVPVPPGTDFGVLHQAALARARRQLLESHAEKDRILGQEVRAIDDLVRSANLMVERLREWYALHAPEATRALQDPEQFARLVAAHGERGALMAAIDQADKAATSLGSDLDPADLEAVKGFAAALAAVHASWHALEVRVTSLMEEVAPNVASVAGPVLGARLVALSGGLARLASWPTGTVQTLGAETALFRHIKEGSPPPKHGILFQHPLVHQAPPWQRGAIARAIALAASTAAKADAFTRNDLRSHLQARLREDLDRIAKDRPRPKPRAGPQRGPWRGPGGGPGRGRGGGQGGPPPRRGLPAPAWQGADPAPGAGPRGPAPAAPGRGPPRLGGGAGGLPGGGRGPPFAKPTPPARGKAFRPRDDGEAGASGRGGAAWRGPPAGGGPGPRRKPQGAFRGPNKPAAPPGKGGKPRGGGHGGDGGSAGAARGRDA